jgi:hypothetical protein
MSRTVTLTQLISDVRARGDLLAVRHSDAEITRNLNQSLQELYDIIAENCPDYYLASSSISVTAGGDTYSLPATFYKVVGVDVTDGGYQRMLRRYTFPERHQFQDSGTDKVTTRYRIMGSNIKFRPVPTWSGTVTLWYIPRFVDLVSGSDDFNGVAGWEEYVIVDCVIKAKMKDEEDVRDWMTTKAILHQRILSECAERDNTEPDRVRDAESEIDLYPWPWPYRALNQ